MKKHHTLLVSYTGVNLQSGCISPVNTEENLSVRDPPMKELRVTIYKKKVGHAIIGIAPSKKFLNTQFWYTYVNELISLLLSVCAHMDVCVCMYM